jgi:hypothetical protein
MWRPTSWKPRRSLDLDRAAVERSDIEHDLLRTEARTSELEPGATELLAEPTPRELRPQAEPILEGVALALEVVEADERASVPDGKVALDS